MSKIKLTKNVEKYFKEQKCNMYISFFNLMHDIFAMNKLDETISSKQYERVIVYGGAKHLSLYNDFIRKNYKYLIRENMPKPGYEEDRIKSFLNAVSEFDKVYEDEVKEYKDSSFTVIFMHGHNNNGRKYAKQLFEPLRKLCDDNNISNILHYRDNDLANGMYENYDINEDFREITQKYIKKNKKYIFLMIFSFWVMAIKIWVAT